MTPACFDSHFPRRCWTSVVEVYRKERLQTKLTGCESHGVSRRKPKRVGRSPAKHVGSHYEVKSVTGRRNGFGHGCNEHVAVESMYVHQTRPFCAVRSANTFFRVDGLLAYIVCFVPVLHCCGARGHSEQIFPALCTRNGSQTTHGTTRK